MQYDCEKVKELLSLYIDDMLCDDEKESVKSHLENCDDCRSEYEFLSSIVKTANVLPALTVSDDLHANIMQTLAGQTKAKPVRKSLWRMASGFAAAAAVIAISVISWGSLPGHPDLTAEPTTDIKATMAPAETTDVLTEPLPEKTASPTTAAKPLRRMAEQPQQETAASAASQEAAENALIAPAADLADEPAYTGSETAEPEAGSFSRGKTVEAVTCYYIAQESYEEAVLILDAYEFNGLSYRIPAGEAEAVCAKLEGLSGYVRHVEEASEGEFVHIALACE